MLKDDYSAMFISMAYPESSKYHSVDHMSIRLQKEYKDIWLPKNKKRFDQIYNKRRMRSERKTRQENKKIFKTN